VKKVVTDFYGQKFSPKMTDVTLQAFERVGQYTPRLIKYKEDVWFDLRVFRINEDGYLIPTSTGLRYNLDNAMKMRKTLNDIGQLISSQKLFKMVEALKAEVE
jgi:hypothetical protein